MGEERYTTHRIPDEADVENVLTGDELAGRVAAPEAELADRFWERIRIFATRRLRDPTAGEDVAQETLRRVVDALRAGRIENLEALPGFVFQTARHICLQRDRSVMRETRALSRLAETDFAKEPDALAVLISEERCASVRRALAGLEQQDRALLRELYFDGCDTGNVAERMGVSAGALRVRKHRALKRLSELLSNRNL